MVPERDRGNSVGPDDRIAETIPSLKGTQEIRLTPAATIQSVVGSSQISRRDMNSATNSCVPFGDKTVPPIVHLYCNCPFQGQGAKNYRLQGLNKLDFYGSSTFLLFLQDVVIQVFAIIQRQFLVDFSSSSAVVQMLTFFL